MARTKCDIEEEIRRDIGYVCMSNKSKQTTSKKVGESKVLGYRGLEGQRKFCAGKMGQLVRWQTKEVACLGVASPGAAKRLAIGSSGSVKASSPRVLQITSSSIKAHV